jgi:hypothetical protein
MNRRTILDDQQLLGDVTAHVVQEPHPLRFGEQEDSDHHGELPAWREPLTALVRMHA